MDQITQEELRAMMASMKELSAQNTRILAENAELKTLMGSEVGQRVVRKATRRQLEIRMIDGKAVIGYKNQGTEQSPLFWYKKPNPKDPKEMVDMVDLVLEGATEALPIEVSAFRKESQRVKCFVKEVKEHEWLINHGTIKKREVEEYSSIELDFDVPLDVMGKTYFYTVEVPREFGGPRDVVVHERMCNIA